MSSGASLALETFSFTARSANYVRIVGHGNSTNLWNSYTEVRIRTSPQAVSLSQKESTANTQPPAETAAGPALRTYPNPFHETSTILFSLDKKGYTNLTIYDMTGRAVAVLVNAELPPGTHSATFADRVSPGIYILKLLHNGKILTGKLVKE